jgi:hypothetical protein
LLSKALGETDRGSIVWDHVMVYNRGIAWFDAPPPKPVVSDGPVVDVVDELAAGLRQAIAQN